MKKKQFWFYCLAVIILFGVSPIQTYAGTATVRWQVNTEPDINEYRIYYGLASRNYGTPVSTGKVTEYTIEGLDEGKTYYFAVTAVDTAGNESGYSTEISKKIGSTAPPNGKTYEISLWWTEYGSRSASVPVEIYDGDTLLDTVTVNQKSNGGQWNVLGSYSFAGPPRIVINSQGGDSSTCADAVRIIADDNSERIIDNTDDGVSFTGTWKPSGGVNPYGTGSVYCKEAGATFTFEASPPTDTQNKEISLWWTEYGSRSASVPVEIYDGDTLLDTVTVNQKSNGGQWNVLGSYSFAGLPRIVIISQGSDSTCADAVRIIADDNSERIIDNTDDGVSFAGTWKPSGGVNPYGDGSVYCKEAGATFTFEASPPTDTQNKEISLWWTEYGSRSASVPVEIYDGGTLLDTVTVNQKSNGGQWNVLGSYSFAGPPRIVINSQGADSSTCADAARIIADDNSERIIDNTDDGVSFTGTWKPSGGVNPYGDGSVYCKEAGATFTFDISP